MRPKSLLSALINWGVAFCVWATLFFLVYYLRAQFTYPGLGDAFLVAGVVEIAFVSLIFITRSGIFDVPGYAFRRLFESFKIKNPKSFKDAGDYISFMEKKRSVNKPYYLPYAVFGAISILGALTFSFMV